MLTKVQEWGPMHRPKRFHSWKIPRPHSSCETQNCHKIDICAVTEIWLKPADNAITQKCQPVGYSFTDYPRQSGRVVGGTGLLYRSKLTPSLVRSGENNSFEFSEWLIKCPSLAIGLIAVYRPTYSKEHPMSPTIFNAEFGEYLQGMALSKEPLLITGDFNFHFDDCSDKDDAKFKDLLLEFGLQQHVSVPSHRDGQRDLFITRMSDNTTLDEPIASYYISDHTFIVCQVNTQKPATVMETTTYRKYKQIDIEKFENDIEQSCLYTMTKSTCNEDTCDMETVAAQYNTTLRKSWMIMPRRRLKLWKWNRLCLGITMISKVSNVTDGRQNDSGCSTEVTP